MTLVRRGSPVLEALGRPVVIGMTRWDGADSRAMEAGEPMCHLFCVKIQVDHAWREMQVGMAAWVGVTQGEAFEVGSPGWVVEIGPCQILQAPWLATQFVRFWVLVARVEAVWGRQFTVAERCVSEGKGEQGSKCCRISCFVSYGK